MTAVYSPTSTSSSIGTSFEVLRGPPLTLTPEERQRIYEEEKARHGAPPSDGCLKKAGLGCLGVMVVGIVLLFGLAFLGGLFRSSSRAPTKPSLEVLDYRWAVEEYGTHYIVGTVQNNSDRQYSYVSVEFNIYDGQGNQVGSTLDNVNNLEPHGTWKFKALVSEKEATAFRLKGVNGY